MATSTSNELLDVGKNFHDPLLVTREKPTRLPPSAALSKAKLFLPQLQKANQDLEAIVSSGRRDAVDIEKIDEDEQFIEMNVMLFDDDNSDENGDTDAAEQHVSDSDSDLLIGEVTEENIKLPNEGHRKKPTILEIEPDELECSAENRCSKENSRTPEKANLSPQEKHLPQRKGKRQKNTKSNRKKRKGPKS